MTHVRWTLVLLIAAAPGCRPAPDPPDPVREFAGSYPEAATPDGALKTFELTAAETEVALIDGGALKVWAYNDQVPGPTLRVRLGDTVRVRFTNRLPQETTIHWHGVRVPNAMDGVPHATQPPIRPGASFTYEFTPKDAGTFWFHPHIRSSEQVERGLFGVLIVEDVDPPPFSHDVSWVLDDWLLGRDGALFPEFNTRHDLAHDGRWGNVVTVNGRTREALVVKAGERIRLRLLNVANGRVFRPDLAGLDAKVIAVDGMYASQPLDLGAFELAPGNRLDVDITVPADRRGQRLPVTDRFTRSPIPLAEVVVTDASVATPDFPSPARAHVPGWRNTEELAPRAEYRLGARAGGAYGIEWTINDEAYGHADHGARPRNVQTLPYGEWSKLRFVNQSFRLHPMNIHGQFFRLLTRNGQRVEEPFWRDTVLLHANETVEVGVVPQDIGLWMLHCHILEHAESGMMTLVEVTD